MADAAAGRLGHFAFDDGVPEHTALAATNSILDRAGLNPKTAVEVEVGPTPAFQQIFTGIARGVRRDGTPYPPEPAAPALPAADNEPIDAEIVEPDGTETRPSRPRAPTAPGSAPDGPKRPPPWRGEPPPKRKPSTELDTLEEANADLARERRRGRR